MSSSKYRLPSAKTIFASLANMAKREAKQPRRAAKRVGHMEQQARAQAGWRRLRAARRAAAATRVAARLKDEQEARRRRGGGPNPPGPGRPPMKDRMMAVMEPGKWYGARDIAEMSGLEVRNVRATLIQKLMVKGLVERVQNPAWVPRGQPGGVGNPQQMMADPEVEPMWLYRLTAAGEQKRSA